MIVAFVRVPVHVCMYVCSSFAFDCSYSNYINHYVVFNFLKHA